MALLYENLDAITRRFMADEVQYDINIGNVYLGKHLTAIAKTEWTNYLLKAIDSGTDDTLRAALELNSAMEMMTTQRRGDQIYPRRVRHDAAEVLAEGEFNRFYVRGLSLRALDENIPMLEVYRAKVVIQPRIESEQLIGQLREPSALLSDVRSSTGVETALGVPPGPGTGITVRIPRNPS